MYVGCGEIKKYGANLNKFSVGGIINIYPNTKMHTEAKICKIKGGNKNADIIFNLNSGVFDNFRFLHRQNGHQI